MATFAELFNEIIKHSNLIGSENGTGQNTNTRVGNLGHKIAAIIEKIGDVDSKFLSKVNDDTAAGIIKFLKGIEIGDFTPGFLGSGGAFKIVDGVSELEVDKLTVRMIATFFELVISKITHIGGQLLLTPARMRCIKVVENATNFRCYFEKGENGEVDNDFQQGDQARCQVFTGSGAKFYWRLVTATGDDWIELSKSDAISGSATPEIGDDIIQLGNRANAERQNAMILSTVGSDAPSWKQYKDIDSYSLEGKATTIFSSKGNRIDGTTVFVNNIALNDLLNGINDSINAAIVAATFWEIDASAPIIYKNAPDAATAGAHAPVTVRGLLRQGEETVMGGYITVTPNGGVETASAAISPVTIAPADNAGKLFYTVRLYNKANKEKLLDEQTIPVVFKGAEGENAISAILTNEADVLPAQANGTVISYAGSGTNILVFEGGRQLEYLPSSSANGKFTVSASATNITCGAMSKNGYECVVADASNMTQDEARIVFTISGKTLRGQNFSVQKQQSFSKAKEGIPGSSAPLLYLSASSQIMQCSPENIALPNQIITIEAKLQNLTGNAAFIARAYDDAGNFITNQGLSGSGNTRTLTNNSWAQNYRKIEITATLGALGDTITIYRIKNGANGEAGQSNVFGFLTNENVTVPADSNGVVSNLSACSGSFLLFHGLNQVFSGVTYTLVSQTGCSAGIFSSGGYYVNSLQAGSATVIFRASYIGVNVEQILTISKSIAGQDGKSVINTDVEFAQSSSATVAPVSGWQTNAPAWVNGLYIWTRTKTYYSDGTSTTTPPVNLTGQAGQNGNPGQGVQSITEEYYLSNSKTQLVGGVWQTTPPEWVYGKYIWTRVKIVFKNPYSVTYTQPVCDSSWDAINDIEVGGVNMIRKSNFKKSLEGIIPLDGATKNLDMYDRCVINKQSGNIRAKFLNVELKANKTYLFHCDEWWGSLGGVGFDDGQSSQQFIEIKRESLSLESGTRGFYKIKLSADKTGAVVIFGQTGHNDVRIKRPMLEQATHPSDYSPHPDDVDDEFAQMAYLTDAFEQTTQTTGGVILTSIVGARDAEQNVRSYLSGNMALNPIAIAAGVENFGTKKESQQAALYHNGVFRLGKAGGQRLESDQTGISLFNHLNKRNIRIGRNGDYVVLEFYDNNGNFLYDLGPNGIGKINNVANRWEAIDLIYLGSSIAQVLTTESIKYKYKNSHLMTTTRYFQFISGTTAGNMNDSANHLKIFTSQNVSAALIPNGYYCRKEQVNLLMQYPVQNTNIQVHPYLSNSPYQLMGANPNNETIYDRQYIYIIHLIRHWGGFETERVGAYWNSGRV